MSKVSPVRALCVLAAVLAGATQSSAQAIIPFRMPAVTAFASAVEFDVTESWLAPIAAKSALSVSPTSVAQAVANLNGARGFLAMAAATDAGWLASPQAKAIMDFVTDDPLHRETVKVEIEFLGIASGGPAPRGLPSNGATFRVEVGEFWQVGLIREDPGGPVLVRWPEMRTPPVLVVSGWHSKTPSDSNRLWIIGNGITIEDTRGAGALVYDKKIVVTARPGIIQMINVFAQAKISGFALVDPVVRPHPDNPEITVTVRGAPDPAQPPLEVPSREALVAAGIDVVPLEQHGLIEAVPCTGGVPIARPRLAVRAGASGEHATLRFGGKLELLPVPLDPPFDPVARGVRVRLQDAAGDPLLDETVPGGAFDATTGSGWRHDPESSRWVYARPVADGVHRLVLRRVPGSAEVYRFLVKARLPEPIVPAAEQLPLRATLVIDAPTAEDGQCGEAELGGAPPAIPCPVHHATRLVCN